MTGGFKKTVIPDGPEDSLGVPCYQSTLTYDIDSSSVALTGSFTDQYSYTGSGRLVGFNMEFDHQAVEVKLLVDGSTVFELDANDMQNHGNDGLDENIGVMWEPNKKIITFYPRFPVCFATDIKIQAKETSGNHDRLHYLVCIEKVT